MSKHTPGPWRVSTLRGLEIQSAYGVSLAEMWARGEPDTEKANARLIAAAPDLIAALLYYRDECSGAEPSISVFHRMMDDAIKKAKGET